MIIFDFLKSITQKNYIDFEKLSEVDRKSYDIFMINRYLSMDKRLINAVSQIDKYSFNIFTKQMHYQFLYNIIPKGFIFFDYIKKDKSAAEVKKATESHIEILMKHLQISKSKAKIYCQFLTKEDIKEIKSKYGSLKDE